MFTRKIYEEMLKWKQEYAPKELYIIIIYIFMRQILK